MNHLELKNFLDEKVEFYNRKDFISADRISIPHQFSKKQDIGSGGFVATAPARGNRTTILKSCNRLMKLMDDSPYDFILHHEEKDLKRFENFKHRTFNATDALYFIHFFKNYFQSVRTPSEKENSLENAFAKFISKRDENVEKALI